MKSRREFLQLGAVALTLPLTTRADLSSAFPFVPDPLGAEPLYKLVFDERFPSSVAFGKEAQRLGASVHAIRGDITDLWFNDLHARWNRRPAAIAGLTAHGALFCLERLAWDQRMRVVFRADHRILSGGRIEHSLSGPDTMLHEAAALRLSGSEWSKYMARIVTRCPAARSRPPEKATIVVPSEKSEMNHPDHLISWVIAPMKRA